MCDKSLNLHGGRPGCHSLTPADRPMEGLRRMSDIAEIPLWINVPALERATENLDLVTLGAAMRLLMSHPDGPPPISDETRIIARVSRHAWPRRKKAILAAYQELRHFVVRSASQP